MSIIYRTDDLAKWGTGKGSLLLPVEVDLNFWQLFKDIQDLQTWQSSAGGYAGIDYFTVGAPSLPSNQFTVTLTDHTVLGPYVLPVASWTFRGDWLPNTQYAPYDIFTINGAVYTVLLSHISAATFNPAANDGNGNQYYGLLLTYPANVLPSGGAVDRVLMKNSADDFDVVWGQVSLSGLLDVTLTNPQSGEVLTYFGGQWINKAPVVGVVKVQTQTGLTWTPALTDNNTYNRFTNYNGCTLYLPSNAMVAFAVGAEIHGRQASVAAVVIEALSGAYLFPQNDCLNVTAGEGATFTVKKIGTDEWDIMGRLVLA